ncbi:hypothetical protein HHK36_001077 [Tetracentron sinense]|uniref:BAG family molecular chaperone regulator 1 n=1 Tax=Tetracentron sinense TaxID=13715 RepID=A0A835DRA7_TETSI|nr:hypothetical protein HHK36_001077 [Tetracentron sinense]
MMRMKSKNSGMSPVKGSSTGGDGGSDVFDWELRPGGMLVQKRNLESDRSSIPAPTIKVRVKYGSSYHEIHISSQSTFGDLKKLLAAPTGLHHLDQKLLFKDKERDSNAYLDIVGVKDKSKIVLVEDPTSKERRCLEMRKNAKLEKASKSISEISLEVDKLAAQVSALETVISSGGKVAETDVLNLIELLMNQLIKLDGIFVDGDVKLQRRMQVRRVQKYVETLDLLKIRNAMPNGNRGQIPIQQQQKNSSGQMPIPRHSVRQLPIQKQQQPRNSASGEVVVTTKWETFDSGPGLVPVPSTSTNPTTPKLNWEFFE